MGSPSIDLECHRELVLFVNIPLQKATYDIEFAASWWIEEEALQMPIPVADARSVEAVIPAQAKGYATDLTVVNGSRRSSLVFRAEHENKWVVAVFYPVDSYVINVLFSCGARFWPRLRNMKQYERFFLGSKGDILSIPGCLAAQGFETESLPEYGGLHGGAYSCLLVKFGHASAHLLSGEGIDPESGVTRYWAAVQSARSWDPYWGNKLPENLAVALVGVLRGIGMEEIPL